METQALSIGMRLDALLATVDSLSDTQLYTIIVVMTATVSFLVLNKNCTGCLDQEQRKAQHKWHILTRLNYTAIFSFGLSVPFVSCCWSASSYLHDSTSLLQFLVGWSIFLWSFFGFFGIAFVNPSKVSMESSERATTGMENVDSVSMIPSPMKVPLHPPASCALSCAHPSDCKASSCCLAKDIKAMEDSEIIQLVLQNQIKDHELEQGLDPHRAVGVRRLLMDSKLSEVGRGGSLKQLPQTPSLDYTSVHGANCEIVVGYVPLPVGMVGPLTLNGDTLYVPMATTEGCLVASTNRGAKAVTLGGGAVSTIVRDGITRAPCIRMKSATEAAQLKLWCEQPENFSILKQAFDSTTRYGKLQSCNPKVAGKNVYVRLVCFAGDAMGMNMVSIGSLAVVELLKEEFPSLSLVALSGNMCTDKKAAATNWIEGRGKSVVVDATIPKEVVETTLKTTVKAIVETNLNKNLVGSAMAGTIGGFNAHASNIVTAIFLATGQDPAQNSESSNCITLLEETEEGDLWISCTMPSIEVGTVGGGTSLQAQSACLEIIGCRGGSTHLPGDNSRKLAQVVAATTLCGELSLLAANTLVQAQMKHNRKPVPRWQP